MVAMTRRKAAFFLIGFGFGLIPSLVAILLVLASLHTNGHIGDYSWVQRIVRSAGLNDGDRIWASHQQLKIKLRAKGLTADTHERLHADTDTLRLQTEPCIDFGSGDLLRNAAFHQLP